MRSRRSSFGNPESRWQIEYQHFGCLGFADFEIAGFRDLEAVAGFEVQTGDMQRAARHMDIDLAPIAHRELARLPASNRPA